MNSLIFHVLQMTFFVFIIFFGFNFMYEGFGSSSYFPEELRIDKETAKKIGIFFSILGAVLVVLKLIFLSM
ncbi:hypothetical protein [Thermotomaculum hydrothermale]|uniref:hypothetical protein n=1 Tax=Thermotomaculum hydrothermale TaxID=981385 RepID=UPI001915F587|nr:hypothetical protein [Thermotomaculum hydrothermale]